MNLKVSVDELFVYEDGKVLLQKTYVCIVIYEFKGREVLKIFGVLFEVLEVISINFLDNMDFVILCYFTLQML